MDFLRPDELFAVLFAEELQSVHRVISLFLFIRDLFYLLIRDRLGTVRRLSDRLLTDIHDFPHGDLVEETTRGVCSSTGRH